MSINRFLSRKADDAISIIILIVSPKQNHAELDWMGFGSTRWRVGSVG